MTQINNVFVLIMLYFLSVLPAEEPLRIRDLESAPYDVAVQAGILENKKLKEASGITCSRIHRDVLWVLNDSGNKGRIYAVGTDGSDLGDFKVDDAENRDWEDMASFRLENKPYLLIADTGDNDAVHKKNILYFVPEPDVRKTGNKKKQTVTVAGRMQFSYEDGPRDCEAVAVDIVGKKILLLSKRDSPPVLYELPLNVFPPDTILIAKRLTKVPTIPPPSQEEQQLERRFGIHSTWITAMDISPDGQVAVVLTYKDAYMFEFNTDWTKTFTALPKHIQIPLLVQSESLCFGLDGRTLYLTSEKKSAPLYRFEKK
ncbi:hypothetical protein JXQ31_01750 [candidate division KSB1 bacterium]|nr:hypothetical protein [candidate division KSB1 bacterium]